MAKKRSRKSNREQPPVTGRTVLFVGQESIGHVENFAQSSDTDRKNRIRKIVSEAPKPDPNDKWVGDGSSDPD
jgi:hypothetical protein